MSSAWEVRAAGSHWNLSAACICNVLSGKMGAVMGLESDGDEDSPGALEKDIRTG